MPWYSSIPKQQVEHDSMGDWDWKATAEREWKRAEEMKAEIELACARAKMAGYYGKDLGEAVNRFCEEITKLYIETGATK